MAGRKNHTSRRPQAKRRADGTKYQSRPPAVPVESMIVPKGKCFFRSRFGKLIFTAAEADKALKQAQASRARKGSGYAESRSYECPKGGCGGWHLTSRESWTDRGKAS